MLCCVVMFYSTVLFSPCASYILSIDVVYRLPVCNHCITSNVNQALCLARVAAGEAMDGAEFVLSSQTKAVTSRSSPLHRLQYMRLLSALCIARFLAASLPLFVANTPIDLTPPRARSHRHCLGEAPRHDSV